MVEAFLVKEVRECGVAQGQKGIDSRTQRMVIVVGKTDFSPLGLKGDPEPHQYNYTMTVIPLTPARYPPSLVSSARESTRAYGCWKVVKWGDNPGVKSVEETLDNLGYLKQPLSIPMEVLPYLGNILLFYPQSFACVTGHVELTTQQLGDIINVDNM